VLSSFGDGDDVSVIAAIERAVWTARANRQPIDIVVMGFGAFSADDAPPPMAYTIGRLLADSVVVASAGNNSSCRPFFPAALPNVVAVGGLDSAGRAAFSNFGSWVDACAPAVDVVSTFFMEFTDDVDSANGLNAEYRGWAAWSGTSFAAPKVAGVIAQEMCVRGDSAKATWKRLSDHRRFRYPDLGVVFNA
jgi:subtilisin family serine protease